MDWIYFVQWFVVMFPIAYSPGPNNIVCASVGGRYGLRNAIPFIIGLNTNIILFSLLIGFGIVQFVEKLPTVMIVIKHAGAAYILYLAYKFYRFREIDPAEDNKAKPGFFDGIVANTLNPKCFAALVLMHSQFIRGNDQLLYQVVVLTIWAILLSISAHFVWTIGGSWISRQFTSKKAMKIQGYVFSAMLVAVAIWIALQHQS